MTTPRQPRLARSSTADTRPRQVRSPGSRPMALTRRPVSPRADAQLVALLATVTDDEVASHLLYFSDLGNHYLEHLQELRPGAR
jgi:hypothetical protein